jgi:hypothetical protein
MCHLDFATVCLLDFATVCMLLVLASAASTISILPHEEA